MLKHARGVYVHGSRGALQGLLYLPAGRHAARASLPVSRALYTTLHAHHAYPVLVAAAACRPTVLSRRAGAGPLLWLPAQPERRHGLSVSAARGRRGGTAAEAAARL